MPDVRSNKWGMLALLCLSALACEEDSSPASTDMPPDAPTVAAGFSVTLGGSTAASQQTVVPSGVLVQNAIGTPLQLVSDKFPDDGSADTIGLDFDLNAQTYTFNPGAANTLTVNVRVRNNFTLDASAVSVVLKAINPATGRAVILDDRPVAGVDNTIGVWRYTGIAPGAWSAPRTWTFTVPNNSAFTVTGEVWAVFDNDPPVAAVNGPFTITPASNSCLTAPGVLLSLDASGSSDPDVGDSLVFAWDTDNDGLFDDATGPAPTFTFVQMGAAGMGTYGDHTVSVQVTDSAGFTDTASTTVTVNNVPFAITSRTFTMASVDGTGSYGKIEYTFNRPVFGTLGTGDATFWDRLFNKPYDVAVAISGCKLTLTPERPIGYNFNWESELTASAPLRDGGMNPWIGPDSYLFSTGNVDQVVFSAILPPDNGWSLYKTNSSGGDLTKINTFNNSEHVPAGPPRWSYDGLYITYAVRKDNEPQSDNRIEMRRFSLINFQWELLTPPIPVSVPSSPTMSPDNRYIGFSAAPIFQTGTCSDNNAPCSITGTGASGVDLSQCACPTVSGTTCPAAAFCMGAGVCSNNTSQYCSTNAQCGGGYCIVEGYCSDNRQPCDQTSNPAGINKTRCANPADPNVSCVPSNTTSIFLWDTDNSTVIRAGRRTTSGADVTPHFSPDGKFILYNSGQVNIQQAWKFPVAAPNTRPTLCRCKDIGGSCSDPGALANSICMISNETSGLFSGVTVHPRGDLAVINIRSTAQNDPLRLLNLTTGGLTTAGNPFLLNQPHAWGSFNSPTGTQMIAVKSDGTQLLRVNGLSGLPTTTIINATPGAQFFSAQWYAPPKP